jgi:hypothetical protein
VVNITGFLDTSDTEFPVAPVVDLSELDGNDPLLVLNGLRVDKIQYCMSENLSIRLLWDATTDRIIVGLAGHGEFCFDAASGLVPVIGDAGYTGDINMLVNNVVVTAAIVVQTYNILVYMTKIYVNPND